MDIALSVEDQVGDRRARIMRLHELRYFLRKTG